MELYAAAFQIVSHVCRDLGEDVWPQPYNYSKYDGADRYLTFFENETVCRRGSHCAVAKILCTIDQEYGAELMEGTSRPLKERHTASHYARRYSQYSLEKLKEILVELADDSTILTLFSECGF